MHDYRILNFKLISKKKPCLKLAFISYWIASKIRMHIFSKASQLLRTKKIYILFDWNDSNYKALVPPPPTNGRRGIEHLLRIHLQFFETLRLLLESCCSIQAIQESESINFTNINYLCYCSKNLFFVLPVTISYKRNKFGLR